MITESKALEDILEDVESDDFHFMIKYGVPKVIQVKTLNTDDYKKEKIKLISLRCNGSLEKKVSDGQFFGFDTPEDAESFIRLVNDSVENGIAFF